MENKGTVKSKMKMKKGVKMLIAAFMNIYIALIMLFYTPGCNQSPVTPGTPGANDKYIVSKVQRLQTMIVKLPDNYNPAETYPVLFALHGNGGDAAGLASLFNEYSQAPVIIAVPQGLYSKYSGGYSWFFETNDKDLWEAGDPLTVDNITSHITELKSKYKIGKVYIFGFSQGASVAYMTGLKNPTVVRGIAAVGGSLPDIDVKGSIITSAEVNNAVGLKVLIARGTGDPLASRDSYDRQVDFFKTRNFTLTNFQYMGAHELNNEILGRIFLWIEEDKGL